MQTIRAPTGLLHVSRGGGWSDPAGLCRSARRLTYLPDPGYALLGLRVSLVPAEAAESRVGETKQITNTIGMKLTLIPSGELMMGSGESAEDTAAFFNKTYGEDDLSRKCLAKGLTIRSPATVPFPLRCPRNTRPKRLHQDNNS